MTMSLDHRGLGQSSLGFKTIDVLSVILEQLASLLEVSEKLVAVRVLDLG